MYIYRFVQKNFEQKISDKISNFFFFFQVLTKYFPGGGEGDEAGWGAGLGVPGVREEGEEVQQPRHEDPRQEAREGGRGPALLLHLRQVLQNQKLSPIPQI